MTIKLIIPQFSLL